MDCHTPQRTGRNRDIDAASRLDENFVVASSYRRLRSISRRSKRDNEVSHAQPIEEGRVGAGDRQGSAEIAVSRRFEDLRIDRLQDVFPAGIRERVPVGRGDAVIRVRARRHSADSDHPLAVQVSFEERLRGRSRIELIARNARPER